MKKTFKLNELDCAHCAAKMEEAIKKLDGVSFAGINFIAQKLTLEADDSKYEEILNEVKAVIKSIEPDCTVEV